MVNLDIISFLNRNKLYIIIGFLGLVVLMQCNGNSDLKLVNNHLKKENKDSKKKVDSYYKVIIDLEKTNSKIKDSVSILKTINEKYKLQIAISNKKTKDGVEVVKNFKPTDISKYYVDRYKDKEGVNLTEQGVCLSDTIAKKNIIELVEKDGLIYDLETTNKILENTDKIVVQKDSVIGNLEKQKEVFVSIVSEKDIQNKNNEEIIKYTQKQLRKEKRKKTFLIIGISALISSAIYQNVIK